jgi:hypothetical protein
LTEPRQEYNKPIETAEHILPVDVAANKMESACVDASGVDKAELIKWWDVLDGMVTTLLVVQQLS